MVIMDHSAGIIYMYDEPVANLLFTMMTRQADKKIMQPSWFEGWDSHEKAYSVRVF